LKEEKGGKWESNWKKTRNGRKRIRWRWWRKKE
jgi:hypothetical protein